jgi:hypothetical protein
VLWKDNECPRLPSRIFIAEEKMKTTTITATSPSGALAEVMCDVVILVIVTFLPFSKKGKKTCIDNKKVEDG